MKKLFCILLALVFLAGSQLTVALTTEPADIGELEEAFPDLVFQEVELTKTMTILQVYEVVSWTASGTGFSENLQSLLNRSDEFDLASYGRVYYEEISLTGDKLVSFTWNPLTDFWQKTPHEPARAAVSESDYASYTVADYQSFARRPGDYEGELIQLTGKVLQVMEGDGYNAYRVAQNDNYDHIWYIGMLALSGAERILEDDRITFYGMFTGLETYETVMGASLTIPSMLSQKYEIH